MTGVIVSGATGRLTVGSAPVLLERESECVVLDGLVDGALAGRAGVAVIEGPPGIGKSALLARTVAIARERGLRVLAGGGGEFEREFAFGVARQLFEPVIASLSSDERRSAFAGAAGLAGPLVGLSEQPPRAVGDLFPFLHGLYWLTAGLSGTRPLVIVLDDVQWADLPSLQWLHYLVRRLEGLPVAVVLAGRSTRPEAPVQLLEAIKSERDVMVLRPGSLSEGAAGAVLSEIFGEDPEPEFSRAACSATGGNPFLLRELGRAFEADGGRPLGGSVAGLHDARPEAIARRVLVRLGHMSAASRALAQAVVVFGGAVELPHAAAVAELSPSQAREAADELNGAALLAPDRRLRFTHDIVRSVIYGDLTASQRSVLHHRAAETLIAASASAERVAAHLLLTDPAGDQNVVEWLEKAAAVASAKGSLGAACAYLRRSLEEPAAEEIRPRVLRALAGAEAAAADPNSAARLTEAFACAADPGGRAEVLEHAAEFMLAAGRVAEALRMLDTVRAELSGTDPNRELELEAQFVGAAIHDPETTGLAVRRLLAVKEDLAGDTRGERMMLCHLVTLRSWRAEDAARATVLALRAVGNGRLLEDQRLRSHELSGPITALICADELEHAQTIVEDVLGIAQAQGSEHLFAFLAWMRSLMAYRIGAVVDAEAEARACVEITLRSGLTVGAAVGAASLIGALLERGELAEAEQVLDTVRASAEIGPHAPFGLLLAARGRLRLALGDRDGGLDDLLECGRRNRLFGIENPVFIPWRADAVCAHRLCGDLDAARALARDELRAAKRWGTPGSIGAALRLNAMLAASNDGAIAQLQKATALLRASPAKLELARALVDLGAALRRAGRRAEARPYLREALDLATRCHASVLGERAHSELAATGARVLRRTLTGVASLTASERRVAHLAAAGKSNPEIAQLLFVTRKTVETHLGHVYAKLDISSRQQLAQSLAAE